MDDPNIQTFDDGKTKVSGEIREDKVCWTAGDNPLIETCRECFDDRTRDHGKCFDDECDCWCMLGKQWPIWALFGLKPPEGSLYELKSIDDRQVAPAPGAAAPVRSRRPVLLAWLGVAALALVVLVTDGSRHRPPTGPSAPAEPVPSEDEGNAVNVPDLQGQAAGAFPPDAGSLVSNLLGGLKMPDKPRRNWLRPDKDGICRNQKTGEELRTQVVLRGSCWEVLALMPGDKSCPSRLYDPPPEVMNDKNPRNADLKRSCFKPWGIDEEPQSIEH
jgi:hypothetical protein